MDNQFQIFKRFVSLTAEKRKLEAEVKALESQLDPLQEILLTIFQTNPGMDNIRVDGYTVFQEHTIWARAGENKGQTLAALQDLGFVLEDVVNVNAPRLSALVREYRKEGKELPANLAENIIVTEKVEIKARKV